MFSNKPSAVNIKVWKQTHESWLISSSPLLWSPFIAIAVIINISLLIYFPTSLHVAYLLALSSRVILSHLCDHIPSYQKLSPFTIHLQDGSIIQCSVHISILVWQFHQLNPEDSCPFIVFSWVLTRSRSHSDLWSVCPSASWKLYISQTQSFITSLPPLIFGEYAPLST